MTTPINLQSNYPVLAEQESQWQSLLLESVTKYGAPALRLPAFGGMPDNRAQAAAWLGTPVDRTFIATAGHHGLLACVMGGSLVGKTIAVEALTYPWFVRQAQMLGCRIVPIALDAECMVPEALDAACHRERIDLLYTMPSMHNPTGVTASLARRQQIVQIARRHDFLILEDAAYGFLVADEPPRYIALASERSFYVESLSKRVAPGLRTAFVVAPEHLATDTELALRLIASGSSTLLASLGCAMAADGRLAAIIQAKRSEGERRRQLALSFFQSTPSIPAQPSPFLLSSRSVAERPAVDATPPLQVQSTENSWHLWLTLPTTDTRTDEDIERLCESRNVLITGARWFTAPGVPIPRAIRLGLGGETEWDRVAEGLRIVAEILQP